MQEKWIDVGNVHARHPFRRVVFCKNARQLIRFPFVFAIKSFSTGLRWFIGMWIDISDWTSQPNTFFFSRNKLTFGLVSKSTSNSKAKYTKIYIFKAYSCIHLKNKYTCNMKSYSTELSRFSVKSFNFSVVAPLIGLKDTRCLVTETVTDSFPLQFDF